MYLANDNRYDTMKYNHSGRRAAGSVGFLKPDQIEDAVGLLEKPNFGSDELQLIESILAT